MSRPVVNEIIIAASRDSCFTLCAPLKNPGDAGIGGKV
jgi:hypothetical protein